MREDTSTSPTTTAGEPLLARIKEAIETYGHLQEFRGLVLLLIEMREKLIDAKDSGE